MDANQYFPWAVTLDEHGYLRSRMPFEYAAKLGGSPPDPGAAPERETEALPICEEGFLVNLGSVQPGDQLLFRRSTLRTGRTLVEEIEVESMADRRLLGRKRIGVAT